MEQLEELQQQAEYWANEADETLNALESVGKNVTAEYAAAASSLALFYQIKNHLTRGNVVKGYSEPF